MKRREGDFHGGRGIHCLLRKLEQGYNFFFQKQKLYRAKKRDSNIPPLFTFRSTLEKSHKTGKKKKRRG